MDTKNNQSGGGPDGTRPDIFSAGNEPFRKEENSNTPASLPPNLPASTSDQSAGIIWILSLVATIYFGYHLLRDWSKLKQNEQAGDQYDSLAAIPMGVIRQNLQLQNAIYKDKWGAGISITIWVLVTAATSRRSKK